MTRVVLTFGLLSGLAAAAMVAATVPFAEQIGFGRSIYVGYTVIVISMLFVYFGIRSYRDTVLGGTITFSQGFKAGILITLISSSLYVVTWLILYYNFLPDFGDQYAAYLVDSLREKGASQSEIADMTKRAADMNAMLKNPLLNAAVSFTEPLPVGLLITLISSAALRKREPAG
jgi:hypothetical protein